MHCPNCQAEDTVSIRRASSARQIGTFSLAGAQFEVSANSVAIAECGECDLSLVGHLENPTYAEDGITFTGGHFVVPHPPD
jgi:Zn ribbon nucleic-acid-binding protein